MVLATLCLAVWAQSSALALEHQAHHASQHCCLLCHAGPLPFLKTTVGLAAAPALRMAWFALTVEFDGDHDVLIFTRLSRAPPAVFPS